VKRQRKGARPASTQPPAPIDAPAALRDPHQSCDRCAGRPKAWAVGGKAYCDGCVDIVAGPGWRDVAAPAEGAARIVCRPEDGVTFLALADVPPGAEVLGADERLGVAMVRGSYAPSAGARVVSVTVEYPEASDDGDDE